MIDKYRELPRADPTLLYAEDLLGRAVTLEIEDLRYETQKAFAEKGELLTLRFKGKKKRLVLCNTNVRLLWALFGKDDAKAPVGKQITLQATKVESFGETVDAIRIKGAPWLREAISIMVPQGKTKVRMRLVPTGTKGGAAAKPAAEPEPEPTPSADDDAPPAEHWQGVDQQAST